VAAIATREGVAPGGGVVFCAKQLPAAANHKKAPKFKTALRINSLPDYGATGN
jgi:hypothetical protein